MTDQTTETVKTSKPAKKATAKKPAAKKTKKVAKTAKAKKATVVKSKKTVVKSTSKKTAAVKKEKPEGALVSTIDPVVIASPPAPITLTKAAVTEGDLIWNKIKDSRIMFFGIEQPVKDHVTRLTLRPDACTLQVKSPAIGSMLDVLLNVVTHGGSERRLEQFEVSPVNSGMIHITRKTL